MAPKSDPGGLPEAPEACRRAPAHPRSTQEQQTATKKSARATQERPKSAGKRFSRFSRPRASAAKDLPTNRGVRISRGVGLENGVFAWRVCQISCFFEVLEKMASPKLKLKL